MDERDVFVEDEHDGYNKKNLAMIDEEEEEEEKYAEKMNQLQKLMIEIADNMADKLLDKDVQLKGIQAFVSLLTAVPPYKKTLKTKIITKTKGIKRVLRVSYFSIPLNL